MIFLKKRREPRAGFIQGLGYGHQLLRFSLIFSVNYFKLLFVIYITIISSYNKYCGIVFLVICFLIQLCFMINKTVYQEKCKIICKSEETKENQTIKLVLTFEISPSEEYEEDN